MDIRIYVDATFGGVMMFFGAALLLGTLVEIATRGRDK